MSANELSSNRKRKLEEDSDLRVSQSAKAIFGKAPTCRCKALQALATLQPPSSTALQVALQAVARGPPQVAVVAAQTLWRVIAARNQVATMKDATERYRLWARLAAALGDCCSHDGPVRLREHILHFLRQPPFRHVASGVEQLRLAMDEWMAASFRSLEGVIDTAVSDSARRVGRRHLIDVAARQSSQGVSTATQDKLDSESSEEEGDPAAPVASSDLPVTHHGCLAYILEAGDTTVRIAALQTITSLVVAVEGPRFTLAAISTVLEIVHDESDDVRLQVFRTARRLFETLTLLHERRVPMESCGAGWWKQALQSTLLGLNDDAALYVRHTSIVAVGAALEAALTGTASGDVSSLLCGVLVTLCMHSVRVAQDRAAVLKAVGMLCARVGNGAVECTVLGAACRELAMWAAAQASCPQSTFDVLIVLVEALRSHCQIELPMSLQSMSPSVIAKPFLPTASSKSDIQPPRRLFTYSDLVVALSSGASNLNEALSAAPQLFSVVRSTQKLLVACSSVGSSSTVTLAALELQCGLLRASFGCDYLPSAPIAALLSELRSHANAFLSVPPLRSAADALRNSIASLSSAAAASPFLRSVCVRERRERWSLGPHSRTLGGVTGGAVAAIRSPVAAAIGVEVELELRGENVGVGFPGVDPACVLAAQYGLALWARAAVPSGDYFLTECAFDGAAAAPYCVSFQSAEIVSQAWLSRRCVIAVARLVLPAGLCGALAASPKDLSVVLVVFRRLSQHLLVPLSDPLTLLGQ